MKVYIYNKGDESVGIFPTRITIDGLCEPEDMADRRSMRGMLGIAFSNIEGGLLKVVFEDEEEVPA